LLLQRVLRAAVLARDNAGNKSAAKIAMMAMTTSSSMSVKARRSEQAERLKPELYDAPPPSGEGGFWENGANGFNSRVPSRRHRLSFTRDAIILTIQRAKSNPPSC
jgi:hypothetical protein